MLLPAAFYSHVNDRDNEAEIANQLVASGLDVASRRRLEVLRRKEPDHSRRRQEQERRQQESSE